MPASSKWTKCLSRVKVKLRTILAQHESPIQLAPAGPTVIMVAGVNGAGKTTSIAKLAYLLSRRAKKWCWVRATHFGPRRSNS